MPPRLRLVHAIHDFLPRHQAGSELYAADLAAALQARGHHVTVLAAEHDPARRHGEVRWRVHDGLSVVEIVNNWQFSSFEEAWSSPALLETLGHVLRATGPDVLHVHSLLNLSLELPALARSRGIPVMATLHDHTLACPSGGQRLHEAESHVCHTIEVERCARCFRESPFHAQIALGAALGSPLGRIAGRAAGTLRARAPALLRPLARVARHAPGATGPSPADIATRLDRARRALALADCVAAPSASIARAFVDAGFPPDRLHVEDYGLRQLERPARRPSRPGGGLRIGFVGTIVPHKGAHVLVEAVRRLGTRPVEVEVFGDLSTFPAYASRLAREAAGLPIRFMGRFERADVARIYARMDVLVVPSLWLENSPLVIHEAFQTGVPVVGARMGGIANLIRHDETGLLYDAPAPEALAAALARLLDEPGLLERLAAQAPAWTAIDDDAARWEARYLAAIAGRRRHEAHPS